MLVACGTDIEPSRDCVLREECTPAGPDIRFLGTKLFDKAVPEPPSPTALGGEQVVTLWREADDGELVPFVPVYADILAPRPTRVLANGSELTIFAEGLGEAPLIVRDEAALVIDWCTHIAATFERAEVFPTEPETIPDGREVAFAPGPRELGVRLFGRYDTTSGPLQARVVDTSLELSLAGAQRAAWDTLSFDGTQGSHVLTVVAGNHDPVDIDVAVVANADAMTPLEPVPTSIPLEATTLVCFEATNAERYVAGLTWTFLVDGVQTVHGDGTSNRNCARATSNKTSGTISVEAQAGGQTATVMLAVEPGA